MTQPADLERESVGGEGGGEIDFAENVAAHRPTAKFSLRAL